MLPIASLIRRSARRHGRRTAVLDGDRSLSFREVDERSDRLAHALTGLSPVAGSRVALVMPNRLEHVEVDFAVIKAGKVKVPVNTRLRPDERRHLIEDSGADVLVFDGTEEDWAADLADELPHLRLVRVGSGTLGLDDDDLRAQAGPGPAAVARRPEDPSLILYTSGTTGRPKGATWSNAGRLAATIAMLTDEIDPRPGDAMAHVGSMAHGSGSKVLAHFVRGSRTVPVARFDPERFLDLVAEHRATHTFLVPTMVAMLVDAAAGGRDPGTLRQITYGGAPTTPAALDRALAVLGDRLVQVYGSCEAPHPVLVLDADDHRDEAARRSSGRETTTVETRLVLDGRDVADGEAGELWVRGPAVMLGYWGRPDADAEVFVDGWYRTGDVAVRDDRGYLTIVDRLRDLVISGGYNVYPAEVEAALADHPDLAEVCVIGIPDDRWGEAVTAVVVPRPGATVTPDDVRRHCEGRLAGYKKPRVVEVVDELPKGSTGKVLKRELRDRRWTGSGRRV